MEDCETPDFDDLLMLHYLQRYEKPTRFLKDWQNPLEEYRDDIFRSRYRLSKACIISLLKEISDDLKYATNRNFPLTPLQQLLIILRFYATGTFQVIIGDLSGLDKSTVCRTVHKTTRAIASLSQKYINFPNSIEKRTTLMKEFYSICKFPNVIGTIDCTHIAITSPGGERSELYRNRKGYFSINVQTIACPKLYIRNIIARWPGSVHDSTIFQNCEIRALFESGVIKDCFLLGDNGYACKKYLLTPIINPVTEAEKRYNKAHIKTRNTVERQYGVWKRRFPCIKYGLHVNLKNALPIIVATAILHNIAILCGEEDPPDDENLSTYFSTSQLNSELNTCISYSQLVQIDDSSGVSV